MLCQALCIILHPSAKSIMSHSLETFNLGQNWWFFVLRDLQIWGITLKNNRSTLLYYACFMHRFKSIGEVKLELMSGNAQFRSKLVIFVPHDLQIWMTLKNNRSPFLYNSKLCISYQIHQWHQTWVTVRKCSIPVKISNFLNPCDLEIWQMTLINNRAPLQCCYKLCVSFHSHWWIQTGVTVLKHPFGSYSTIFLAVWPWNLRDNLKKQ